MWQGLRGRYNAKDAQVVRRLSCRKRERKTQRQIVDPLFTDPVFACEFSHRMHRISSAYGLLTYRVYDTSDTSDLCTLGRTKPRPGIHLLKLGALQHADKRGVSSGW